MTSPPPTPRTNGHPVADITKNEPRILWEELSDLITCDFHQPDLQGLLVTLCSGCSHYYPGEKPVWLLVLGASGSGKTELLSQLLLNLRLSRAMDDVTPKAFLSSWSKGPRNNLLPAPGSSSLWVCADFSTLCSLGSEDRKKVASSLRQIWDGKLHRDTGSGPSLSWWGKVSLIAMSTPELESQWGSMRSLGERFLYLRWRSPLDSLGAMRKSRGQLGRMKDIREGLAKIIRRLCDPSARSFATVNLPSDTNLLPFDQMSALVALLRTGVVRDYDPQRSILSVNTPEVPTRISSALAQVARTHQAMFDLPPILESLALCRRLAVDCVPPTRKRILDLLWSSSAKSLTWGELLDIGGIPKTTLTRQLEDLEALRVLDSNHGLGEWPDRVAQLSPWFTAATKASTLLD